MDFDDGYEESNTINLKYILYYHLHKTPITSWLKWMPQSVYCIIRFSLQSVLLNAFSKENIWHCSLMKVSLLIKFPICHVQLAAISLLEVQFILSPETRQDTRRTNSCLRTSSFEYITSVLNKKPQRVQNRVYEGSPLCFSLLWCNNEKHKIDQVLWQQREKHINQEWRRV